MPVTARTIANWVLYSAEKWLSMLYHHMYQMLLKQPILHADETTIQVFVIIKIFKNIKLLIIMNKKNFYVGDHHENDQTSYENRPVYLFAITFNTYNYRTLFYAYDLRDARESNRKKSFACCYNGCKNANHSCCLS
uniref:IS66 family transposase n=1 Tax=Aeribacillus alveayuensis TaxID=279215 RepID=UPI003AF3177E